MPVQKLTQISAEALYQAITDTKNRHHKHTTRLHVYVDRMEDGKVTWMRSLQHKNDLAVPTNSAIGPSLAQRRVATSRNPTTCTLPSDVISTTWYTTSVNSDRKISNSSSELRCLGSSYVLRVCTLTIRTSKQHANFAVFKNGWPNHTRRVEPVTVDRYETLVGFEPAPSEQQLFIACFVSRSCK